MRTKLEKTYGRTVRGNGIFGVLEEQEILKTFFSKSVHGTGSAWLEFESRYSGTYEKESFPNSLSISVGA